MARLFVLSGASIGMTFDIDGSVALGRGDDADVVLREPSISRKHAQLEPQLEPGVWKVIDLNSSNGLHFGGRRVREATVRDGEIFKLGEVEIRLRDDADAAQWTADRAVDERPAGQPPGQPTALGSGEKQSAGADAEQGFELEFGDDIDREIAKAPTPEAPSASGVARTRPGKPAPERAGARATQARAARRAAAVGSMGAAPGGVRGDAMDGGKPVLQYHRKEGKGIDVRQLPGGMRALIVALAIATALGVAYGAFTLTRTARSQASALAD